MKKSRKQILKELFWYLFLFGFTPPALISIFVIGLRFDYLWAVIVNGFVLLYWPIIVPLVVEDAFRKQK